MRIQRAVNVQFIHLRQLSQRRGNRPTQVVSSKIPVVGRGGRVWWVERGRFEAEREGEGGAGEGEGVGGCLGLECMVYCC
jgi:hypothetical protein